jgi:pimeloyl-ACP methyl ester carboxylesterase
MSHETKPRHDRTDAGLAHDRTGSGGGTPVVLVHAGIADRGMWDPVLAPLAASYDVVRVDLRGFGGSGTPPRGPWSHAADVAETLTDLGIDRAHLVGCSLGAGVCAELAVTRPELVASLVLAAPGGALLTEATDDFREFARAEGAAMEDGDLDAATEANLRHWVDGPGREPGAAPAEVRDQVRVMQRHAFELTHEWPDAVWEGEEEADPPVADRLAEVAVPTLVVSGGLDMDTVGLAAARVAATVPGARHLEWPDVAHLPSMERPDDFATEVLGFLATVQGESARA